MESNKTQIPHEILIRKASGETEIFSTEKLKRSLYNAGASHKAVDEIVANMEEWIFNGVTTKQIYSRAFSILHRERSNSSIRYKLKQAIMELGPTGYPFEHYIGLLFEKQGYKTEVGIVVDGNCVTHEMDVIATKDQVQHLMECKYHSDQGKQVSVQVPLYVRSRVDDIVKKRKEMPEYQGLSFSGWVVTNTRFSSDSIQYGLCSGLHLMSWDFPTGKGLKDMIEQLKIYPITILHQLTKNDKRVLLEQGLVSCTELLQNLSSLDSLSLSSKKHKALIQELHNICN